jgi:hypothetical protein
MGAIIRLTAGNSHFIIKSFHIYFKTCNHWSLFHNAYKEEVKGLLFYKLVHGMQITEFENLMDWQWNHNSTFTA